jgi:hypothetical protein
MAPVKQGGGLGDAPVMGTDENREFAEWLPSLVIHVSVTRQHGQFYAVAKEFGIAGVGPTEDAACSNVARLIETYLRSYFREGRPYQDALKPAARRRRGLIGHIVDLWPRPVIKLILPSALR